MACGLAPAFSNESGDLYIGYFANRYGKQWIFNALGRYCARNLLCPRLLGSSWAGACPEPDVAVVAGTAREYWDAHPSRPVLVVEVADSSVALDREHKLSLYARAGVPDYWILNIGDGLLEVYRHARGPVWMALCRGPASRAWGDRLPRGRALRSDRGG